RIFERLRDEHGFTRGITIVKDYLARWRQRAQEMVGPPMHPPAHPQADFGEAIGIIGGVERKINFFAFDLPHSDSCFVVGYPALNAHLLECCRRRMADCLRGHDGTIGERLERDLAALQTPLPAPYDALREGGHDCLLAVAG